MNNAMKNNQGMVDGLTKGGLAASKADNERELQAWIDADAARKAKYGDVLAELKKLRDEQKSHRDRDMALGAIRFSSLLGAASSIVRMAEERPKPDKERDPSYQKRNWKRKIGRQMAMSRRYNRILDRAMFALALERAARDMKVNASWLKLVVGKGPVDAKSISRTLDRLYAKTKLEDQSVRVALLTKASTKKLKKSRDPFIRLALTLRPLQKEMEDRGERVSGAMARLRPRYMAALREFKGDTLAPDANGTLRVTYGTVRGYRPQPTADLYEPFTTVEQMIAKHTAKVPFNAPEPLRAAAKAGNFGPYVDPLRGKMTIDFLSDLDSTGGNSGSATLNAKGELVGLLFDGNYESMASDWLFIPELTRAIHVDIRYALWIMDAVDGADHLLNEMGVTPAIN